VGLRCGVATAPKIPWSIPRRGLLLLKDLIDDEMVSFKGGEQLAALRRPTAVSKRRWALESSVVSIRPSSLSCCPICGLVSIRSGFHGQRRLAPRHRMANPQFAHGSRSKSGHSQHHDPRSHGFATTTADQNARSAFRLNVPVRISQREDQRGQNRLRLQPGPAPFLTTAAHKRSAGSLRAPGGALGEPTGMATLYDRRHKRYSRSWRAAE
jgi:hypothetical protein